VSEADELVELLNQADENTRDERPTPTVTCACGHVIFDGEAIRSRCVKPAEGVALCRCKRWIAVPVQPVR